MNLVVVAVGAVAYFLILVLFLALIETIEALHGDDEHERVS